MNQGFAHPYIFILPCPQNDMVEARYPSDQHRDDVGLLWYADISVTDGTLKQLTMTPTRLR